MSSIHIRAATRDDLDAIEEIERRCFGPVRRSSRRVLQHSLRSTAQSVWLAVAGAGKDRTTAGAMVLYHYPRSIRIFSVAVLPAFRHGGTGRRFVRRVVAMARRDGLAAVTLEAERRNHRLIAWYEAFGFEVSRVLNDYYAAGRHAVRMRLVLVPARQGGRIRGRS